MPKMVGSAVGATDAAGTSMDVVGTFGSDLSVRTAPRRRLVRVTNVWYMGAVPGSDVGATDVPGTSMDVGGSFGSFCDHVSGFA